ncbi:MAG: LptF/LptG family permease [Halanaerobacter sp.]
MKIVDKYLTLEFIKPFFIVLFALTVIMISTFLFQLTDFIIIKKVPLLKVGQLLLYKLPSFVVETLSMAVLFSTLLALSRLVKDSEYTALRMGGITFKRLLVPLLILGLLISGVTYSLNEHLVPWANTRYENAKDRLINKEEKPHLKEDLFFKGESNRYFYIKKLDQRQNQVTHVLIYDLNKNQLLTAPQGQVKDDILNLQEGIRSNLASDGYLDGQSEFETKRIDLKQDIDQLIDKQKKPSELSSSQLKERIRIFKQSGLDTTKLLVEYHFKLAQSLACLIFVLIGAPLSVKSDRGRVVGIIISVVIVFVYYVLLSLSKSLGKNGLLTPFFAAWLPNLIFVLLGSSLIIKEDSVIN